MSFLLLPLLLASPTFDAQRIEGPIVVDGRLDDAVWQRAARIRDFRQAVPDAGEPATFQTEVAVAYDDEALYVAVWAHDDQPTRAMSFERDQLWFDDKIRILLDSYNDQRNAYLFGVNPNGVMADLRIAGNGRHVNRDWDGLWWVEVAKSDKGWTAEFRIPFATLRFPAAKEQVWGFNVERFSARRRETVRWQAWQRSARFNQVARAGKLLGIRGVKAKLGMVAKPYLLGGYSVDGELYDVGMDVDLQLSAPLALSLTVNPDFAQAEADQAQVNLGLDALYLPEKRRFFLEGKDFFGFPMGGSIRPFYSRRIGLTAEGETVPIQGGARILGKWGHDTLGLLATRMAAHGSESEVETGVFRYSRDVLTSSTAGGLLTLRRQGEALNAVAGTDFRYTTNSFRGQGNLVAEAAVVGSLTQEGNDRSQGFAHRLLLSAPNDRTRWKASWSRSGASFDPALGFLSREAFHRFHVDWTRRWRPKGKSKILHNDLSPVNFSLRLDDPDLALRSFDMDLSPLNLVTRSGHWMFFAFEAERERLDEDWQLLDNLLVPAGDHWSGRAEMMAATPRNRPFGLFAYWGSGPYFGAWRSTAMIHWRVSLNPRLSIHGERDMDWFDHGGEVLPVAVTSMSSRFALSRALYGTLKAQHISTTGDWRLSGRLRYLPFLGLDSYLVYNHTIPEQGAHEYALLAKVVWQYAR